MRITVDILKKINSSVATGDLLPIGQFAKECGLDEDLLKTVAGSLDEPVVSVNYFFATMESYVSEVQKRIRMLSECYSAIQKLQMDNGIIKNGDQPAIIW